MSSHQGGLVPRGPYTEWWWPELPVTAVGRGFGRFEHTLVPELDPGPAATYFWAHQFQLEGGEGGYLGLQTRGHRADGSVGKTAIFSIWDALGAEGPGVLRFGGEGTGWSARLPYPWSEGHSYRLVVELDGTGPDGTWWTASVADLAAGAELAIGRVRAPPTWGGLGAWSIMWTEYYGGPVRRCSDLAPVRARFTTPTADGSIMPVRRHSHLGDGDCDTTRITELDDGVRHELGLRA